VTHSARNTHRTITSFLTFCKTDSPAMTPASLVQRRSVRKPSAVAAFCSLPRPAPVEAE